MKKQFKTLIVICTILATCFTTASANEGNKLQIKSTSEVVNTLNKKGKKIVKKNSEDLNLYLAVMDMYSKDPANFYNLDEQTKAKFFAAASNLNKSLASSKNKELKNLGEQIAFNQAVSNYIWNVKKSNTVVLPVVEVAQQTSL
ncbi:hypothetical protein [Leadbetterella sp. DM7]|uniref:hypothetical protein n=1 Tax=Leadbetterella sp. DM7 TaxID=3235085 RepID=UPI00349ECB89